MIRYSQHNYPATHFANAACICGGKIFNLLIDDSSEVAIRKYMVCKCEHPMGDSADANIQWAIAPIIWKMPNPKNANVPVARAHFEIAGAFEITAGVAFYTESEDVK